MKPLTPKLKESLMKFKTPREALTYKEFDYYDAGAMECFKLVRWVTGFGGGRYILTPDGVTAWEELRREQYRDDGLECSECPWIGWEENAKLAHADEVGDDTVYMCPKCGADCAHTPIDEQRRRC